MKRVVAEADTIMFAVGIVLLVIGAWLVYRPAAFLLGGAIFCGLGYSAMLRKPAPPLPGEGDE